MLAAARARFATAGIDIAELRTTGDAAYFSEKIAAFCRGNFPAEAPSDPDTATSQSDPDPAGGAPETPGHESGDTAGTTTSSKLTERDRRLGSGGRI
ncbi:MAG: hypothetical protein B6245_04355 [Desulfobacteraceae bacterium 4572_88]|nr:MAG: hypothetical protein B6245_04355 [Desulfobacteraceae bacterium 4572_88]